MFKILPLRGAKDYFYEVIPKCEAFSFVPLRSCLKMIFRIFYNCKSGRWGHRPRRMPRLAPHQLQGGKREFSFLDSFLVSFVQGDSFGVVKYFVPILILRYFVELFFYGEKIRLMTNSKIMIPPRNKN